MVEERCPGCNGKLRKIDDVSFECEDCGQVFDQDDFW